MRSIRRERESLDPAKNPDWNKLVVDTIYNSSLDALALAIPHYEADILKTEDGKFRGYDFSKEGNNPEVSGRIHLMITVDDSIIEKEDSEQDIKFLLISMYFEGTYIDKRDRLTDKMYEQIFSIEQNLSATSIPLDTYSRDLLAKVKEYTNVIRKYV